MFAILAILAGMASLQLVSAFSAPSHSSLGLSALVMVATFAPGVQAISAPDVTGIVFGDMNSFFLKIIGLIALMLFVFSPWVSLRTIPGMSRRSLLVVQASLKSLGGTGAMCCGLFGGRYTLAVVAFVQLIGQFLLIFSAYLVLAQDYVVTSSWFFVVFIMLIIAITFEKARIEVFWKQGAIIFGAVFVLLAWLAFVGTTVFMFLELSNMPAAIPSFRNWFFTIVLIVWVLVELFYLVWHILHVYNVWFNDTLKAELETLMPPGEDDAGAWWESTVAFGSQFDSHKRK